MAVPALPSSLNFIDSGKLRALAAQSVSLPGPQS
jgi:hypothetical protein